MSKRDRYRSPVPFKDKAATAQSWHGIADTVREQLAENCALMSHKRATATKLVGFALGVYRETGAGKIDRWKGNMILRLNNNLLAKNVLRYNLKDAFKWDYVSYGNHGGFYHLDKAETETIDLWYKLNARIKERRHNGVFDFVAPKIISVRVSFYAKNWPGMYYDELFDLVENNGNRRNYFQTFWEDGDQAEFDGYMMQQVLI